ncbi:MAG: HAMP domain-containing sensor histidine kinase [Pseudomonadota bacterium]
MFSRLRHHLYARIYMALLASLVLAATLFALVHLVYDPERVRTGFDTFAEVAGEVLPPPDAPQAAQQEALERWHDKVRVDMSLYSADGVLIASAGARLPPPPRDQVDSSRLKGHLATFVLKLPDGRALVCRRQHSRRGGPIHILFLLAAVAVVVAIGAFPVVRRLTRRLERLQGSVEKWGTGELSTRVAVEGRDEVARLATSFNQAAGRIQALVGAQKSLLANASHELRSPLARIRMAVELMQEQASPAIRAELNQNISELDQLIDEVLLASRLDATGQAGSARGQVDLTAIVAEECTRVGAAFDAEALLVEGDARLLRRLLRNLLENAKRYGAATPVMVDLRVMDGSVRLDVCDQGPGVPEDQRERIFEPFYRLPGASEAAGGVGLGLSLVRQIAKHHGGDVACLANKDGGCCFRVTLPDIGGRT